MLNKIKEIIEFFKEAFNYIFEHYIEMDIGRKSENEEE